MRTSGPRRPAGVSVFHKSWLTSATGVASSTGCNRRDYAEEHVRWEHARLEFQVEANTI
jgi:hypothetical protein